MNITDSVSTSLFLSLNPLKTLLQTGWTPLHYAVYQGDYESVKALLDHPTIEIQVNLDESEEVTNPIRV